VLSVLYALYKSEINNQTKDTTNNYRFYLKSLNNNKQIDLLNNNTTCTQLRNCYIIYVKRNKKLQKEIKRKTKIYTRKSVKTNYKSIQSNVDKDVTTENQPKINKYLFEQINTKIDNKYKIAHRKRYYNKNDATYLQQLDF